MIKLDKCQLIESVAYPVASSINSLTEGSVLVFVNENGGAVVQNSAGTAADKFAGIVMNSYKQPTTTRIVEELVVPASGAYTIELSNTPVSATEISVVELDAGGATANVLTAGTPASEALQYSISGKTITLNSARASDTIRVVYSKELTVTEANVLYGNGASVTQYPMNENVFAITTGEVYTDQYDPKVNWLPGVSVTVKTGANGLLTIGGNGQTLDAVVTKAPSADDAFLGIRIKP
jgi:hypothetical protein